MTACNAARTKNPGQTTCRRGAGGRATRLAHNSLAFLRPRRPCRPGRMAPRRFGEGGKKALRRLLIRLGTAGAPDESPLAGLSPAVRDRFPSCAARGGLTFKLLPFAPQSPPSDSLENVQDGSGGQTFVLYHQRRRRPRDLLVRPCLFRGPTCLTGPPASDMTKA